MFELRITEPMYKQTRMAGHLQAYVVSQKAMANKLQQGSTVS